MPWFHTVSRVLNASSSLTAIGHPPSGAVPNPISVTSRFNFPIFLLLIIIKFFIIFH
tara:strand:- start:397 stop:567 length:171 start_codon:yes stop_codon:yes gene_type:complete